MAFAPFNAEIRRLFQRYGEAPALLSQDGQILSFARVERNVAALVARLASEGVGPGSCVAPITDNRVLRMLLMFALLRRGADCVLVNTPDALRGLGDRVDTVIRFADQSHEGPARQIVFTQDWLETDPDPGSEVEDAGRLITGTSGSTGRPKFIRSDLAACLDQWTHRPEGRGVSRGAILVSMPEVSFVSVSLVLRAFISGHAVMWLHASPAQTLTHAARLGICEMMMTPLALSDLLTALGEAPRLDRLKILMTVGAIVSGDLYQRAQDALGAAVATCFGSSEMGHVAFGMIDVKTYQEGWCGQVIGFIEARVDAAPGEVGPLRLRMPAEARPEGYLGGAPVFDAEGWFHSGDLARLSPDGELTLFGRADNVINIDGTKIAAELVEMLACQCPGVTQAGAFRLALGQDRAGIGLAVEAGPGFDADQVASILGAHLRMNAPIRVVAVPALPRLPSGKLDRKAVSGLFG